MPLGEELENLWNYPMQSILRGSGLSDDTTFSREWPSCYNTEVNTKQKLFDSCNFYIMSRLSTFRTLYENAYFVIICQYLWHMCCNSLSTVRLEFYDILTTFLTVLRLCFSVLRCRNCLRAHSR